MANPSVGTLVSDVTSLLARAVEDDALPSLSSSTLEDSLREISTRWMTYCAWCEVMMQASKRFPLSKQQLLYGVRWLREVLPLFPLIRYEEVAERFRILQVLLGLRWFADAELAEAGYMALREGCAVTADVVLAASTPLSALRGFLDQCNPAAAPCSPVPLDPRQIWTGLRTLPPYAFEKDDDRVLHMRCMSSRSCSETYLAFFTVIGDLVDEVRLEERECSKNAEQGGDRSSRQHYALNERVSLLASWLQSSLRQNVPRSAHLCAALERKARLLAEKTASSTTLARMHEALVTLSRQCRAADSDVDKNSAPAGGAPTPTGFAAVAAAAVKQRAATQVQAARLRLPAPYPLPYQQAAWLLAQKGHAIGVDQWEDEEVADPLAPSSKKLINVLEDLVEDDIIGSAADVWLQVDPVVDRLILPAHLDDGNDTFEEIVMSHKAGALLFSRTCIYWAGEEASSKKRMVNALGLKRGGSYDDFEVALSIRYEDIEDFSFAHIGEEGTFYLAIHAKEIFKFFPFYADEMQEITSSLSVLLGKSPTSEYAYITRILAQRLERARRTVLQDLLKEPSPWIGHSTDLQRVIKNLCADKAQNIYDMERLFHSCRVNGEVTKEAIRVLAQIWQDTTSEPVRMRVLRVVDRLLNRSIMGTNDPRFHEVVRWLDRIEKSLDPYRSGQSVQLVHNLKRKYRTMQRSVVAPLLPFHWHAQFDHWDEYLEMVTQQEAQLHEYAMEQAGIHQHP